MRQGDPGGDSSGDSSGGGGDGGAEPMSAKFFWMASSKEVKSQDVCSVFRLAIGHIAMGTGEERYCWFRVFEG